MVALPREPLNRKWLINFCYTVVRGQFDSADEHHYLAQLHDYLDAHPEDTEFRDEIFNVLIWEMRHFMNFVSWLNEKRESEISALRARVDTLEAQRG